MRLRSFWVLFLASFVEGGAVMAAELIGAKLVAPYYGSSLYVWAAVLAITLGGLATGYFLGGIISARYPHRKTLYRIMLASSVLVALMPQTAVWILEATLDLEIRVGITLSCMVFLFPPLILFGMVSPLIVRLITFHEEKIGVNAGTVYTIATIGGILVTFLMAFYAIPDLGLRESAYLTAMLLALLPLAYFLNLKKFFGKTTVYSNN